MAGRKIDSEGARGGAQLELGGESPGDAPTAADAPRSFEDGVRRLGEIVERLEEGDLPLEDSLRLFEEGVRLAKDAQAKLDSAEKRVEELLGVDEDGVPRTRLLESE